MGLHRVLVIWCALPHPLLVPGQVALVGEGKAAWCRDGGTWTYGRLRGAAPRPAQLLAGGCGALASFCKLGPHRRTVKGKGCVRAASACSVCPGRETWITAALGRINISVGYRPSGLVRGERGRGGVRWWAQTRRCPCEWVIVEEDGSGNARRARHHSGGELRGGVPRRRASKSLTDLLSGVPLTRGRRERASRTS